MKNPRYIIYCQEIGHPITNPFHQTDDQEEAEITCKDLAHNNQVYVSIFDRMRDIDYYVVNPLWKDKTNVNKV